MRYYLGVSPAGPTVFSHIHKDDTGEPLLLVDEGAAKKLRLNFSDWLESGETISSATVTTENCTVSLSTSSPNVDLTISAVTSYAYGRAIVLVTSSTGEIWRQVIRIRRTNRYTEEQKYRDYA